MKRQVCIVGMGEIGGVFARGFLKAGHPVYPVLRGMDLSKLEKAIDPEVIVISVAEKDFSACLSALPRVWHDRLVLVQNELLPCDWERHGLAHPTVISIWFEKKWPQDYKVIIPSPVFGPHAPLIETVLKNFQISTRVLKSTEELLFELVLKNLYILTINIAGLEVGGTVGELWSKHEPFARGVASDVLDVQFKLIGRQLDRAPLIQGMRKAFEGDWNHKCMGRTALARLQRVIAQADEAHLDVNALRQIQTRQKINHS